MKFILYSHDKIERSRFSRQISYACATRPRLHDLRLSTIQNKVRFKKKKNENSNQNENLIFNQNWNELIPERLVREQNVVSVSCKLEIHFRKNLAKLTGSAVRVNSKKPMGKKTMKCFYHVFIMNSKILLRKNSSNEYLKTISHYFLVYSLSGFMQAARLTDWSSSSLLSLKFRSPFFRFKPSTERISSHLSNRALLCFQPAVICLRNTLRFANVQ